MVDLKIFVINMKRSHERREWMEKQMDSFGISFEFFDAIDGKILPKDVVEKSRSRSNKWYKENEGPDEMMKLGEIGVAMSHYNIYKKIDREDIELAIILEDDAQFDERFPELLNEVESLRNVMKTFDLVLLGYCTNGVDTRKSAVCSHWGKKKISDCFKVGIPILWYWLAIGYIISKNGARLLAEKQGEYPCVTADILTANSPQYGLTLGVLTNPIIWPSYHANFSTIQVHTPIKINKYMTSSNEKKELFSKLKTSYRRFRKLLDIKIRQFSTQKYQYISDRY